MIQQLKALTILSEDLGSNQSTHMVTHIVHNSSSSESDIFFWPLPAPGMHWVYIHAYAQAKH